MLAALGGFTTIWLVIAVGMLLAHLGIISTPQRRFLNNVAFLVASPALLFSLVARASLGHLFAHTFLASIVAIVVAGGVYLLIGKGFLRRNRASLTIGFMTSAYTNAGNLGLPIAAAIMGDMTWMAPILLVQVVFLQPTCLAILDLDRAQKAGRTLSPGRLLSLPFRNPITIGILLGLLVNITGLPIPEPVMASVTMVGQMAVPMMLLAFGVSLRLDPLPGVGPHLRDLGISLVIKILLMPTAAFLAGRAIGLAPSELLAVTVVAALPTAQNVYVISSRYDVEEPLGRDAVFWSTILSSVAIVLIATLLTPAG